MFPLQGKEQVFLANGTYSKAKIPSCFERPFLMLHKL